MTVLFYLIPLMVLGFAIALGPLVIALFREHRVTTATTAPTPFSEPASDVADLAVPDRPVAPAPDVAPERPLISA